MSRMWENVIVVILIMVIFCLVFPIVKLSIYSSQLSSVKDSVYASINSVSLLYFKENQNNNASLPFMVTYTESNYKIYSNKVVYDGDEKLEKSGMRPIGGYIVINSNGSISVVNLEYSNFVCNKSSNGNVKCVAR